MSAPTERSRRFREQAARAGFLLCACAAIAAAALICVFLFANGIPALKRIGLWDFLSGQTWKPSQDVYGVLPMILGSLYVTAGALIIGVPTGILTAVCLTWFCPKRLQGALRHACNMLAGIPSVVYGFFGLTAIVPAVRSIFGGSGQSMLAASLVLGIMILPTIVGVSESAMRAVPASHLEGALALGASRERAVFTAALPAARSGVFSSVVLALGRAVGETTAVIMVAGNQPVMPSGLADGLRTLTANIAVELSYAADLHYDALIATGLVLFVLVLIINFAFSLAKGHKNES